MAFDPHLPASSYHIIFIIVFLMSMCIYMYSIIICVFHNLLTICVLLMYIYLIINHLSNDCNVHMGVQFLKELHGKYKIT